MIKSSAFTLKQYYGLEKDTDLTSRAFLPKLSKTNMFIVSQQ